MSGRHVQILGGGLGVGSHSPAGISRTDAGPKHRPKVRLRPQARLISCVSVLIVSDADYFILCLMDIASKDSPFSPPYVSFPLIISFSPLCHNVSFSVCIHFVERLIHIC